MLFSVHATTTSLGLVDLPAGDLVAGRLQPSPQYGSVREIIRDATNAFLHLGLFDAVAPMLPALSAETRRRRRALARAARLQLSLVGADGARVPTDFVNLLEAPGDGGIVVLASFVSAPTWVGAALSVPPAELISRSPTA
jgi:hypothetical protein